MSQPHEPQNSTSREEASRNVFVRFQQRFERGFNRFRERYGVLLERVIARRSTFVTISLAIAVASLCLFFFLGRDYFPEIKSGIIQMHMRAPLGTRIEVSGRIATLVSRQHRGVAARCRSKTSSVIAACRSDRTTSPSSQRRRSARRIAI